MNQTDTALFRIPKDKCLEIIENSVNLAQSCLQPMSVVRRSTELPYKKRDLKRLYEDLANIAMEELYPDRIAILQAVSSSELEVVAALNRWHPDAKQMKGWAQHDRVPIQTGLDSPYQRAWESAEIWLEDVPTTNDTHRFVAISIFIEENKTGLLCLLFPSGKSIDPCDLAAWTVLSRQISLLTGFCTLLKDQDSWHGQLNARVEERTHQLLTSEKKYRRLLENMVDGIFITDLDGRFTFVSPQAASITGHSQSRLLQMSSRELVIPEDVSLLENALEKARKGEKIRALEIAIEKANGERVFLEVSGAQIFGTKGEPVGFEGLARDITEHKLLKRQIRRASKMEALGRLAGGIAHEFNNLLMGILGNATLVLLDFTEGNPHHDRLKRIEKLVEKGSSMTNQLLGFARKGRYEVERLDLNQLIKKIAADFCQLRKEVVIRTELAEDLCSMEADRGQIEQAVMHLLFNSTDAMPEGGEIILRTRNEHYLDIKLKDFHPDPGWYVVLTVQDEGIGMDKATMDRIFDPFFTTKELGKGTGLGLAATYGVVRGHKGSIQVESEKGKGARFHLYFPAAPISKDMSKGGEPHRDSDENLNVLFVDDEEEVLDVGSLMLEKLGHAVTKARGGQEAIRILKSDKEKIDLIILDIVMPEMGGNEIYDRLKEIDPKAKVLLSSGYSIDDQAAEILKRGNSGFLQKPYRMNELAAKIKEILEQDPYTRHYPAR